MEYRLGLIFSLAVGFAVGILVVVTLFRKKVLDCTFDERQERARGVAFKYGFFTLMIAMAVYGATEIAVGRWCDAMAGCVICITLGMAVFAITCILKDAYLSLKEKPRYVMTLFVLLSVFNLGLGVIQLRDGDVVENGILTFRCTNLLVGGMILVILAVYAVNFSLDRREETE